MLLPRCPIANLSEVNGIFGAGRAPDGIGFNGIPFSFSEVSTVWNETEAAISSLASSP
jgi:hypothetical protein